MAKKNQNTHFWLPQFWPIWLMFGFGWCIAKLPYSWSLIVGRYLGRFLMVVGKSRRYVTQCNIEACFPQLTKAQQKKLLKENFESVGIAVIEISLAYWGSTKKVSSLAHISGLEHVKAAQAKGQGVFIMAPHMTPLELCLRMFSEAQPCAAMYKESHNPLFESYSTAKRARYTIPIPNRNLRKFLTHIRKGGVAIYLPDQHYGSRNSIFAPFFGIWCATIARTTQMVKTTNAVVLPTMIGRRDDGYHIEIQPPIEYPTDDPVADATRLNQIAEQNIKLYPNQYLWQHRRFKHVADGQPKVY